MVGLDYELVLEDLLAFNLRFLETSAFGRRQRLILRLAYSVAGPALVGVVIALGLKEPTGGVIAALLSGAVGWFASPYIWRRTIRRNLLRLAKGDGLGTLGAHTLSLEADGIQEATTSRQALVSWSSISRVDETADHVLLFFSPTEAFVVPKRIGSAEVDAFMDQVRQRLRTG